MSSTESPDAATVFYEQLENLEDEFEEVELELRKFSPSSSEKKKESKTDC